MYVDISYVGEFRRFYMGSDIFDTHARASNRIFSCKNEFNLRKAYIEIFRHETDHLESTWTWVGHNVLSATLMISVKDLHFGQKAVISKSAC